MPDRSPQDLMAIVEKLTAGGNTLEKIEIAREVHKTFGSILLEDKDISSLFRKYDQEIKNTQHLMWNIGLVSICGHCAAHNPGGSCCGKGIDEWYEVTNFLFNLILGREIVIDPPDSSDCLFLGPEGCRLWARHHFCVNYLCHRIYEHLPDKDVRRLQAQAGSELFLCWELERAVTHRLHNLEARKIHTRISDREKA